MTVTAGIGGGLLCVVTCQKGSLHFVELQCDVQVCWDTGCHPWSLFIISASFNVLYREGSLFLFIFFFNLSIMLCVTPASVQSFPWRGKPLSKLFLRFFYSVLLNTMCYRLWCTLRINLICAFLWHSYIYTYIHTHGILRNELVCGFCTVLNITLCCNSLYQRALWNKFAIQRGNTDM